LYGAVKLPIHTIYFNGLFWRHFDSEVISPIGPKISDADTTTNGWGFVQNPTQMCLESVGKRPSAF